MLKKVIIGSGIALAVSTFVFGRDVLSYMRTGFHSVRAAVKSEVPIEFEIQRARNMVERVMLLGLVAASTVAILTTAANAAAGAIHPRLPAMIEEQDFATWLDPDEKKAGEAMRLLHPPSENPLEFVRIGEAVNKVANDGPFVQQPVEETPRDAGAQEAAPKKKAAGNSPSSPDEGQGSLF